MLKRGLGLFSAGERGTNRRSAALQFSGRKATSIELKVYDNGDHTCLVWLPANAQAIPNCRGFAIHRTRKLAGGGAPQDTYIHGFVGFSDDDKLDPNALWKRPVQRYMCGGTT